MSQPVGEMRRDVFQANVSPIVANSMNANHSPVKTSFPRIALIWSERVPPALKPSSMSLYSQKFAQLRSTLK
jgi:hypothetical protein